MAVLRDLRAQLAAAREELGQYKDNDPAAIEAMSKQPSRKRGDWGREGGGEGATLTAYAGTLLHTTTASCRHVCGPGACGGVVCSTVAAAVATALTAAVSASARPKDKG